MKKDRIVRTHEIEDELFEYELELLDRAIIRRQSHLRSIDELDRKDIAPKQRKICPTKKRKFRDKRQADEVLHFITNRRNEALAAGKHYRFKQYRSYKCPCGAWHHSSRPELVAEALAHVA